MRPFAVRILTGLLSLSTGCSFLAVRGPPSPPIQRAPEVDCTRSSVAPVLDLGIGLAVMGIGVTGLAAESSCRPNEFCIDFSGVSHAGGVIFLAVGGLVVGSSVYGFSKTVSCRAVTDAQRECANGSAEACARLVPLPTAAPESKP